MPVVGPDGRFKVRLLRAGRAEEEPSDGAEALLQAQVDSGFASSSTSPIPGAPALLAPSGGNAQALLEKYSHAAVGCFGEVGAEAFELANALFAARSKHQAMLRLSWWLARVNRRTVRQFLERRLPLRQGLVTAERADAQSLEAAFHHLTANSVGSALKELKNAAGEGPHFDRLATILAACGGTFLPGQQRRWLRQQVEDWKRQRTPDLMSPELWRIYQLLAGDLEVVRDALDWRTAFGVVFWYGQREESAGDDALAKVVASFMDAVKRQGSLSRIRPVPSYVLATRAPDDCLGLWTGTMRRPKDDPGSLQFTAIEMAASCHGSDVVHFDYKTYTNDPLDISLSWHFAVLMLALQGEAGEPAGVAFQRLTQQYCEHLQQQGLPQWAVYVAHFVSEHRARASLVRQLLITHAKAVPLDFGSEEEAIWPKLPANWLWHARAIACEQARDWCGALFCWLRCGGEEARAVTIACGYLLGPALLGHASCPFKRGAVEAILLAPMNPYSCPEREGGIRNRRFGRLGRLGL
ncbi:unnamed protein product [Effrenium voratum]|uniref:Nuclear pore complex protein NUP96 C-terminal domain-containing protein n=1 Tax=Effrenium voratum TaxID=2562239 RepID=A0AA36IDF8_9DINO|nr:unnamed protein product [Effrenium voratum]